MEARYQLFNKFALDDQRNYYTGTINKYRTATSQVNRFRAIFAFLTGLSAAAAGFVVQSYFVDGMACSVNNAGANPTGVNCDALGVLVGLFLVSAVIMPALGAFFSTLADLYQWDRMIQIYDAALENIEVADAQSPHPEMQDVVYRASLRAFTEGTLQVMQDETGQWCQSIRTPVQLEEFIEEELEKAEKVKGNADAADRAARERATGQPSPGPGPTPPPAPPVAPG